MSTLECQSPVETNDHWTDEIVETAESIEVSYKQTFKLQATAMLAVTVATLASLVLMAKFQAPYYGYLIASGTGVIFGLLVRRKKWQRKTSSG